MFPRASIFDVSYLSHSERSHSFLSWSSVFAPRSNSASAYQSEISNSNILIIGLGEYTLHGFDIKLWLNVRRQAHLAKIPTNSQTHLFITTVLSIFIARNFEMDERNRTRYRGCSKITDYEILGKLGEGTFGWVYCRNSIFQSSSSNLQSQGSSQGKVAKEWVNCRLKEDIDAQWEGWGLWVSLLAATTANCRSFR